jgi:hypothetical protein
MDRIDHDIMRRNHGISMLGRPSIRTACLQTEKLAPSFGGKQKIDLIKQGPNTVPI